ncbi:MAG: acetyl/propionyl/methylcrotonyl-CoA carboxylase subunit alpha [Burkholderiaceae bacterium]
MRPIKSLLIANRGEIACRIIHSASSAGIKTIAIYSDADQAARHTRLADEAYRIGPAEPSESYLHIDAIIQLAKRLGVDAIHPGYGFLSENPRFAKACEEAAILFVGPSAASMQALGNKSAARRLAIELGIPVRPGYEGDAQDDDTFLAQAQRIGYPLMIKAAAGGGGRGMRAVDHQEQLLPALYAARAEAQAAFANDQLLLEAFVRDARHIEIQIIADQHGKVLSLFERDCSSQRRHQKILEEAPATRLSDQTRQAMSDAAIRLARAVAYQGAGTVEFLLAADGSFSLLEMNTRLQVEHPVTEAITGIDLVALQLQVAQGQAIALRQEDIRIKGHAIEARLCAEDPDEQCLPQSGPLIDYRWPQLEAVRIDHGLLAGVDMPPHYDSLMAKVIAWGEDRSQARLRLKRALGKMKLLGPVTNRALLIDALDQAPFCGDRMHDIGWLERWMPSRKRAQPEQQWFFAAASCILHYLGIAHGELAGFQSTGHHSDGGAIMRHSLLLHAEGTDCQVTVSLRPAGRMAWLMKSDQDEEKAWHHVQLDEPQQGLYRLEIDRQSIDVLSIRHANSWYIDTLGVSDRVKLATPIGRSQTSHQNGITQLRSRMHGRVISLEVNPGDWVEKGQLLLQIEAMKIQHHIDAPQAGRVLEIHVQDQHQVAAGQHLLSIEAKD